MLRLMYSVLLPFLLPFAAYWAYGRIKKNSAECPFRILIVSGLTLVFLFLFVFSVPERAPAESTYRPPRFENGQIIPALLERKP